MHNIFFDKQKTALAVVASWGLAFVKEEAANPKFHARMEVL